MAVNPLSLAETLRPWRYAGVFALLPGEGTDDVLFADVADGHSCSVPDSDGPAFASEAETATTPAEAAADRRSAPALLSSVSQKPATSNLSYSGTETSFEKIHSAGNPSSVPAAFADEPRRAPGERSAKKQNGPAGALPDCLPEPWQAMLSRTAPAPIIWTYAELGDDLAGRGDQERSACLRYIIGSLNLPKGSSAFWPVCLTRTVPDVALVPSPSSAAASSAGVCEYPDRRFFQYGLRKLSPKVVILLGIQAVELSGLAVSLSTPFTQKIYKGTLYVLLPDFHTLLSKTVLKEQACVFLRSALSGLTLA